MQAFPVTGSACRVVNAGQTENGPRCERFKVSLSSGRGRGGKRWRKGLDEQQRAALGRRLPHNQSGNSWEASGLIHGGTARRNAQSKQGVFPEVDVMVACDEAHVGKVLGPRG